MSAGPAQLTIQFAGQDGRIDEGLNEVYYLAACGDPDAGLAIAIQYCRWRADWVSKGLNIAGARASMVGQPRVSTATKQQFPGAYVSGYGDPRFRDQLTTGLLFGLKDATSSYSSKRCYRCFPDAFVQYDAAGQEDLSNGAVKNFQTELLGKLAALGLCMRAINRDDAVAKPIPINDLIVTNNILLAFNTLENPRLKGYDVNTKFSVTGATGFGVKKCNGVFRITRIVDPVAPAIAPWNVYVAQNKTLPVGFSYTNLSGKMRLRVPTYPPLVKGEFIRYASRDVGKNPSQRRSRPRRGQG